jgi:RimJ/RimL family protein N-acetyltransferase
MTQLSVREMQESDVLSIVGYWTKSTQEHLQGMGVDIQKMPSPTVLEQMLNAQLRLPLQERRSFCLIWESDGLPVGHCNTNPTYFGEYAYMHLHIWPEAARQKGMGLSLLQKSLPLFFRVLQLKTLFCEPYALNEAPNRTLAKAGFRLEKEYITIPGSLNFEQPVNRWVIRRSEVPA